jgi:hypothetical protein
VLVLTALVFVFVMVALLAAVADVLVLIDASAQVRSAAYVGAVAGGQDVNPGAVSGQLTAAGPLSAEAGGVCAQQASLADPQASPPSCTVSGETVTAGVCQVVRYPVSVFGLSGEVCDTERAGAAFGTVTAGG